MRHRIEADISAVERELLAAIDAAAEAIMPATRRVHAAKEAEALALMANPNLGKGEIPHLALEAGRTGVKPFDIAVEVLTRAHADRARSAALEDLRITAKSAVRAAGTVAGKRAAAAVNWAAVAAEMGG